MSRITIFEEFDNEHPVVDSESGSRVHKELINIGANFEHWETPEELGLDPNDTDAAILEAYSPYLDELMGATGAGSSDVVRLTPDHPEVAAMRAKFLQEHTHSEDELRFFVAGSGWFFLHIGHRIYRIFCSVGDMIWVPADVKHWFDAGEEPNFTALRVFTDTAGWVANFTGENFSQRFPAL
jgi:1,2-dihydroxy-3-keto-5-methylthiopentene dioxygenase